MRLVRQTALIAIASLLVALVILVWQARPALPILNTSLAPRQLERAFDFLIWLGTLLIAIGLLDRIARASARAPTPRPIQLPNLCPSREPKRRPTVTMGGYPRHSFPLIPTGRTLSDEPMASATSQGANSPPNAAIPRDASDPAPTAQDLPGIDKSADEPRSTIALLGPVSIAGSKKNSRRLRGASQQLVCYLALRPTGAHRDELIDILWSGQSSERLRERLWRAVRDARDHLGDAVLVRDGETYRLDRSAVKVDVDQLEQLQQAAANTGEPEQRLTFLDSAINLFRGEPLAGTDYMWADGDLRRLTSVRAGLLQQAGAMRLELGDATGALAAAERVIANDPTNENHARLALRAEAALGRRAAVIERYEVLCRQLDEQLGLRPSRETRDLYRAFLSQDPPPDESAGEEKPRSGVEIRRASATSP